MNSLHWREQANSIIDVSWALRLCIRREFYSLVEKIWKNMIKLFLFRSRWSSIWSTWMNNFHQLHLSFPLIWLVKSRPLLLFSLHLVKAREKLFVVCKRKITLDMPPLTLMSKCPNAVYFSSTNIKSNEKKGGKWKKFDSCVVNEEK